jgi:hypothetical protein
MAKALQKSQYAALALFLAAFLLWLRDPSPVLYLLSFSVLGFVWFVAVIWMWRMWHIVATIVAMFAFALYQLPQRLFDLPTQAQELQGVLMALSIVAVLLYLFRDAVIRYARLHKNTETCASPNGGPTASVDNSNAPGGPPSVS